MNKDKTHSDNSELLYFCRDYSGLTYCSRIRPNKSTTYWGPASALTQVTQSAFDLDSLPLGAAIAIRDNVIVETFND